MSALAAACALAAAWPSTADAAAAPHWSVLQQSVPTYFHAGDANDAYRLVVRNDGAASASSVTIADTLPTGATATAVKATGEAGNGAGSPKYELTCHVGETVACTYESGASKPAVFPGAIFVVTVDVAISPAATALSPNTATASGGEAPSATSSEQTPLSTEAVPPFGLAYFAPEIVGEDGRPDKQAGSHPFELATSLAFNVSGREVPGEGSSENPLTSFSAKDLEVALPPGLIGDPDSVPRCSQHDFQTRESPNCPDVSEVGTIKLMFFGSFPSAVYPVYDVVPPPGQIGELGVSVAGLAHIPMFFHVRADGDYGLTVRLRELPETGPLQGAVLTLWGVPAASSHDLEREGLVDLGGPGEVCKPRVKLNGEVTGCHSGIPDKPLLTLPTACTSPLEALVRTDSWQDPEPSAPFRPQSQIAPGLQAGSPEGCERLTFTPSLTIAGELATAGVPSGYSIDVHVPQSEDPTAPLANASLRDAVVRLPAGLTLSPSAANGLQSCSDEAFGLHSEAPIECPPRSQVGTATVLTPLLDSPLTGAIYLGTPTCNPCGPSDAAGGALARLLLSVHGFGVTVKLAGSVSIDQASGQLTATFEGSPQLPFEDLTLAFAGGARAPLANPPQCGSLIASASLTPYSGQPSGEQTSNRLEVTECDRSRFAPTLLAGVTPNLAGRQPQTAFALSISRSDRDQRLQSVDVALPRGLDATLANVARCPAAAAAAAACEGSSRIGSVTVAAGPGPEPLQLHGDVFLTGPTGEDPFGLAFVVPAVAGPLNLGTLVVRAGVSVDPTTGALTVHSGALPQSIDGIPLQIKALTVSIDRAGVLVDPTSCDPTAVTATVVGDGGAVSQPSSRFQAADCSSLPFRPKLAAVTRARASARGAYLHVKLSAKPGEANLAKLKVDLPRQLAVRLSTLQKACPAAAFAADPASCPSGSAIGAATAVTPLLANALKGSAYLVSNGAAAAPSIEMALHGEGITLLLAGATSVRGGSLAAAFRTLPDVPLSTFDLVLSTGPHSLLGASLPQRARGSLCGQRLRMPVAMTAQNGAVVRRDLAVGVIGCPRRHRSAHKR